LYEGAPNQPDWSRFWQIVAKHQVNILYTSPTAIRAFVKAGDTWPEGHDLSSLRLLGTVGEPINPEAWRWFHQKIGQGRCPIVDTWWQTETGSILMTTLPGVHAVNQEAAACRSLVCRPTSCRVRVRAWLPAKAAFWFSANLGPSMLRTIWGDDERFRAQYFSEIPGSYFTGDGARVDSEGYFTVVGRIDDVLNVSGHRLGTAEIESCLVAHPAVAEAAAVGRPHDLKGQALTVFVVIKPSFDAAPELERDLAEHVAREIGKFARPDDVVLVDGLPKTRSGKIMRRILKDVAAGRDVAGDISTLEDAGTVQKVIESFRARTGARSAPSS
jgi:acetyl-CoA synthetase